MPLPPSMGQKVWRLAGRLLNVPPGTGILFGPQARRRLLLAVLGSLVMAAIEVASVTAVVPLMQLITGTPPDEGVPGRVGRLPRDLQCHHARRSSWRLPSWAASC